MFSRKSQKHKIPNNIKLAARQAAANKDNSTNKQVPPSIDNSNSRKRPDCADLNNALLDSADGNLSKEKVAGTFGSFKTNIHKPWPKIPKGQSKLFFECTLFLYSVLALFLQYLNLYKTLWWLPKSYWHYSMKLHLVNPYLLSCVGLILGARVTKCFWETVTETLKTAALLFPKFHSKFGFAIEYCLLKIPMFSLITLSFGFSFAKIYRDFAFSKVMFFFHPLGLFIFIFNKEIFDKVCRLFQCFSSLRRPEYTTKICYNNLISFFKDIFNDPYYLDVEYVQHFCGFSCFVFETNLVARRTNPYYAKSEFSIICLDLSLRLRHAVFVGISTAYLSILIPCIFTPVKSMTGHPIYMYLDSTWIFELFVIVSMTSFSLYIAFLIPIHYLDLFHKNAVHLGCFELISEKDKKGTAQKWEPYYEYKANTIVEHCGQQFIAKPHQLGSSCVAEPGKFSHYLCYKLNANPVLMSNVLMGYQVFLIAFQFVLLIMTIDWQHIVTLVLLMFANFLLLAKFFKDRVVLGRIHNPTFEDTKLISELQKEVSMNMMR